ncbi:hypothetical protein Barb7_02426 [Bacteroidales bacterium Barb7]|nr:hypothetical protein Barb7_02426 [Bacteroidales bacterium Barb7]
MEVVHTLAGGTQSPAGTSYRVGNENGNVRIAAVDIVRFGQQPAGGVGLARHNQVFLLPSANGAIRFYQFFGIQYIRAYACIVIALFPRIQQ